MYDSICSVNVKLGEKTITRDEEYQYIFVSVILGTLQPHNLCSES